MKTKISSGCGCLIMILFGLFLLGYVLQENSRLRVSDTTVKGNDYGYPFINSATDQDGNVMEFYYAPEAVNSTNVNAFFKHLKSTKSPSRIYYAVLVNDKTFAKAPKNLFTALFGIDEAMMRHVVAYFEWNTINGFSESNVYSKSMAQGRQETFKIP